MRYLYESDERKAIAAKVLKQAKIVRSALAPILDIRDIPRGLEKDIETIHSYAYRLISDTSDFVNDRIYAEGCWESFLDTINQRKKRFKVFARAIEGLLSYAQRSDMVQEFGFDPFPALEEIETLMALVKSINIRKYPANPIREPDLSDIKWPEEVPPDQPPRRKKREEPFMTNSRSRRNNYW